MHTRPLLVLSLCALLAAGCEDTGAHTKTGQLDSDAAVNTEETQWTGFQPEYFGVTDIHFGYDFETLQAVPVYTVDEAGNPVLIPISLTVLILDASAAETGHFLEGNHCEVVMTRTDPLPYAGWTGAADAWFGFEISESTGTTNCQTLDFDPRVWSADPAAHVKKWTWGGGVNPLRAEAIEVIGDAFPAFEPWVQGGGFYWNELPNFTDAEDLNGAVAYDSDGYVDVGISYAYQMDAAFNLILDGEGNKIHLPADQVEQPNSNAATAYYEVQVNRFLTPATHLLLEPSTTR